MGDLLGEEFGLVQDDKLYRCLHSIQVKLAEQDGNSMCWRVAKAAGQRTGYAPPSPEADQALARA